MAASWCLTASAGAGDAQLPEQPLVIVKTTVELFRSQPEADTGASQISERDNAVRRLLAGCPQSAASWGELKEDGNVGPDLFAGHSQAHAGRGSIDLRVASVGPNCGGPVRPRTSRECRALRQDAGYRGKRIIGR